MASENLGSTVLHEHRKVVTFRHILAFINFVAILVSTLITRHFVLIRGTSSGVLMIINMLCVINSVQIALCIADYVTKVLMGKYSKLLTIFSYVFGVIWFGAVVAEFISGTLVLGAARIDLGVIAILQLFAAILAYFIWPHIDYSTVRKLTHKNVREDAEKRAKKARGGVLRYVTICIFMIVLQLGLLLSYKLPPNVYDLFSESRQLQYQLSEDGQSYEVIGVYRGTSSYVNVPAVYNNKPVTKIKEGALSNSTFLENHKIDKIDIGTVTTDQSGAITLSSNVAIIESGAIDNDKITSLTLPVSVVKIEDGAIRSNSLKTLAYQAKADFSYSSLSCSALSTVTFSGVDAGKIVSLEGMASTVTLEVAKDSYNSYREKNPEYMSSIRPILADDEFVVDFYTGTDYYIESVFAKVGEKVEIGYQDLKNDKLLDKVSLAVDTLAYLENGKETGTKGSKNDSAFRGWYLDPGYNTECVFDKNINVTFTSDTAIYAKWINEYTGTLDWGTYHPEGQPSVLYWTDEDPVSFPVIKDRVGFDGGIVWSLDNQTVTGSQNISESTTINGKWLFNPPVIDINPYAQKENDNTFVISTDKNTVNFIYDETQKLHLEALMQHEFDGQDKFGYATEWTKVGSTELLGASKVINVQNVPESGEYLLRVIATSPFGDTSFAETRVNVEIAKKALDIGTAKLENTVVEYNAQYRELEYIGELVHQGVRTTYRYYDSEGKELDAIGGVKDAGKYKVVAFFEKNDAQEAANYGTRELNADLVITPCELTFVGWSVDELVYNTDAQSVYLEVDGIRAQDSVDIIYEGNRETNTGTYVAKAIGVSNPNYSISDMDAANKCTHTWKILPKEVSVKEWKLDGSVTGSFKITYNGQTHRLDAVPEGVYASDLESFKFIYDETANTVSAVNANTYTAKIIGVDNSNYKLISESSQAWEIEKRNITVSFDSENEFVYNGKSQEMVATLSGIVAGDLPLFKLDDFTYDGKSDALVVGEPGISGALLTIGFGARNVTSYDAAISGINTASALSLNYKLTAASKNFTIIPKTVTVEDYTTYVYTGAAQKLAVKISGIEKSDLEGVSYDQFTVTALSGGEVSGDSYILTLISKDAGSYSYKVDAFSNSNYSLVAKEGSLTINKKALNVSWKITDLKTETAKNLTNGAVVTYNARGYTATAEIDGIVNGESVNLDYLVRDGFNAGSYTTSVSLPAEYANYSFDGASVNWTILPYSLDFSWSFNKNYSGTTVPVFTYDAKPVEVTAVYSPLGTDTVNLTYLSGKSDLTKTDASASSYKVEIASVDNSNYVIGKNSSLEWQIAPKTVTVNWANLPTEVTYNGKKRGPEFTLEGLCEHGIYAQISVNGSVSYMNINSIELATKYSFADTGVVLNSDEYVCTVLGIYKQTAPSVYEEYLNYEVACEARRYTIKRAPLTLGAWQYETNGVSATYNKDTTKLVYNSKNYTLTTSINEVLFDRDGVKDSVYLSYTNNSNKNYSADGYTARVMLAGAHADNYEISGTTILSWRIEQKPINVEWKLNSFVYNGGQHVQRAEFIYGAAADDDMMVYTGDSVSINYNSREYTYTAINAGSYTAKIDSISNNNYVLVANDSYNWSVAKKSVNYSDLIWSSQDSYVYNGAVQYPTASYYDSESGRNVTVYEYVEAPVSKNVGNNYNIKAKTLGSDNNYVLVGDNKGKDYSITKKPISFTWGYDGARNNAGADIVYDGVERTITAYPNAIGNDVINLTYNVSSRKLRDVNVYIFEVKNIDNANYDLRTESVGRTIEIEIKPRTITLSWGYDGNKSGAGQYSYTGTARELKAYASNICSGDVINFTYSNDSRLILLNAGTYTAKVESVDNENYVLPEASYCVKEITVTPQTLSISWSGDTFVTYDGNPHELTATLKGKIAGTDITISPKYRNELNSITNHGSLTVTVDAIGGSTHSQFDPKNFVLPNSGRSNTLTINQQVLNVSWSGPQQVTYDGSTHYRYATVSGTIKGKTFTVTPVYRPNSGYGENSAVGAGYYSFKVNGLGTATSADFAQTNFTLPSNGTESAYIQIEQRQVYVSWDGDVKVTYDGELHTLTATAKDQDGTDIPIKYVNLANAYTNAGVYKISVELLDPQNYTLKGQSVEKYLTIDKYTASVEWSGDTYVVYDGNVHPLTAKVTGVGGKNLTVTHYNNSNVNAGTYTVYFELSDTTNYKLPTDGTATRDITIAPQPVVITWSGSDVIYYDAASHKRTAQVIGKNNGNNVSIRYEKNSIYSNAGEYEYKFSITDPNYTLDGAQGSNVAKLTIKPQKVKITWSGNETYIYDGKYHYIKPTIIGVDSGENLINYYSHSGPQNFSNVGTYTYSITGLNHSNYTLEGCEGSLSASATIVPAPVKIIWEGNGTYTYTGETYSMRAKVYSWDGSTDITHNCMFNGASAFTNAGTYTYSIVGLDSKNYTLEGCEGSLSATATVEAVDVTVSWSGNATVEYDGEYHTLTPVVKDKFGHNVEFDYLTSNQFCEVGTYEIIIAITGFSTNYNVSVGSLSATLTINEQTNS